MIVAKALIIVKRRQLPTSSFISLLSQSWLITTRLLLQILPRTQEFLQIEDKNLQPCLLRPFNLLGLPGQHQLSQVPP